MRSFSLVAAAAAALALLSAQDASAQDCSAITDQCRCDQPKCHVIVMDVSRSIDRADLFEIYLKSMKKLTCGMKLSDNLNGEDGYDSLGLVTFGYNTKVSIPMHRYTAENWVNKVSRFQTDSFSTRMWGRTCCTPLADAMKLARREVVAAHTAGRIDVTNCKVSMTLVTDGFPVQNKLRKRGKQLNRKWTQEKAYPSDYKLELVPKMANEFKVNGLFTADVSVLVVPNKKDLQRSVARDYFRGSVSAESSFLRKKFTGQKTIYTGEEKTTQPLGFPIVTSPTEDYISDLNVVDDADAVANAHLAVLCDQLEPIGESCEGSMAPTKTPTPAPSPSPSKAPTPSPTPSPTRSPTPSPTNPITDAPTLPPTREVLTCRGDKDLIIVVDASNSISTLVGGKQRRFRDFVLQLAQDVQRIQAENMPKQRTGLITFSKAVVERIPLQAYTYGQWIDQIDLLREQAESLVSCCTPTAEAFRAARKMLEARTEHTDNPAIVFMITDGNPMINKSPYERSAGGEVQHRRLGVNGGVNGNPDGRAVSFGEYVSSIVFKEATALRALPDTEAYLVGVRDKNGLNTPVDYFLGRHNTNTSCFRSYQNTPLQCDTCDTRTGPNPVGSCSANSNNCWVTGAVDHDCTEFYGPLVDDARSVETDDLDQLIIELQTLICGTRFILPEP